jgi:hypothetical protein
MQRFITCPHCERPFRICYEVRQHEVEPASFLPCPYCEERLPNPGMPGAAPGTFIVCRLCVEEGHWRWATVAYQLAVKSWLFVAKVTGPEWALCLCLLLVLGALGACGLKPSERVSGAIVFALPWLAAAVAGAQKIRNRLSKETRGLMRTTFEVAGLLAALVLLILTGFTIAGT